MSLIEIIEFPTVLQEHNGNKIHESILRSYHIADHLLKMVHRGDSKETIQEVFDLLRDVSKAKPHDEN